MPYPGKAPWKDDNTYMQMDLSLYDPETGASLPRTKTPAGSDRTDRQAAVTEASTRTPSSRILSRSRRPKDT